MPTVDNDSAIRDRAYLLWEKAGQPSGREHEHWAEARRQIEAETLSGTPIIAARPLPTTENHDSPPLEFVRLREALYTPEPFSFELFGAECPEIDLPIIIHHAA